MRWASSRAPVTACGEQHERSPSVAESDHSSSVTATTSSPASRASWAAAAESTPPLMATSVRRGCGASSRRARLGRGAERPVQRVRGQRGGVALGRDEAAERAAHVLGGDAGRVQEGAALHELHDRASGRPRRAAALRVETGLDDAVALDPDGHAQEVPAGCAAGRSGVSRIGQRAEPAGGVEMVLEEQGAARLVAPATTALSPHRLPAQRQWQIQHPMDASATTRAQRVDDLIGDPPVAPRQVGFRVTQDELSGDLENVVANVVGPGVPKRMAPACR